MTEEEICTPKLINLAQKSNELKKAYNSQHDVTNVSSSQDAVDRPLRARKSKMNNQTFDARMMQQSASQEGRSINTSDCDFSRQEFLIEESWKDATKNSAMLMHEYNRKKTSKLQQRGSSSLVNDSKIISSELEIQPEASGSRDNVKFQAKKNKFSKVSGRDVSGSVILHSDIEQKKFTQDFKRAKGNDSLQLNLGGLIAHSQGDQSIGILPEINSADGLSKRHSPHKIKNHNRMVKMQLSNIRSEEEDKEDSPVVKQRRALNQFAASISASQESRSPAISTKKSKLSHLSINLRNPSCFKASDLPMIDLSKGPQSPQRSPLTNKLNKLSSPLETLEEIRVSRNQTLMEVAKRDSKKLQAENSQILPRKKKDAPFQGLNMKAHQQQEPTHDHIVELREEEKQQHLSVRQETDETPGRKMKRVGNEVTNEKQNAQQLLKECTRMREEYASSDDDDVVQRQDEDEEESKTSVKPESKQIGKYKSGFDVAGVDEPLPILVGGTYHDEPEHMWKKKRLKQNLVINKLSQADQELQQEKEAFELAQRQNNLERRKAEQKLQRIQEHLSKTASNIKVKSNLHFDLEDYPHLFKYKIYESFKPADLKQARNYIAFLTQSAIDVNSNTVYEEDLSPELYNYLSKDMNTKLPNYINQKKLLQFDTMFESGNLDSAYLVNETEYNLLCKTDTNTKGNTYWFYFKVLNWTPKATATFNLLNVARDLHPFYSKGMQIWTRTESTNGRFKSEWQCSNNGVDVIHFQPNEIERSKVKKKEYAMGRYYNTLKFKCKFPEILTLKTNNDAQWPRMAPEDTTNGFHEVGPNDLGSPGNVLSFAYSLPYCYSDLISDLNNSKRFLLQNGGIVVNEQKQLQGTMQEKRLFEPKEGANVDTARSRVNRQDKEDRQKLTKNELATREMKKIAIKTAKDRMGQFELQLIQADEEQKSPLIRPQQNKKAVKLLEIHTDYLYYKQEIASQSVGGLDLYQITLTKRKGPNCVPYHRKKCMYISARMHAAETHGSLIMKYILQMLVTKAENYDSILSNYIVKLVPLINPDGVTIGNSRASLVGLDLNRRWAEPNASIHPEIYFLKLQMQQQANSAQGISIFCDLHGHNRKENCFFYGCNKAADEGMLSWTKTRLLPKIFASVEQIFDFSNCRFKQDKYKLNTARVVVWNEMKVTNSFTLETSQYGKTAVVSEQPASSDTTAVNSIQNLDAKAKFRYIQFQFSDMRQIAKSFLVSTAQYTKLEKELEKEWKLSVGWFKPTKLNEVTGEAIRDKQKRELNQKRSIKDQRKENNQDSNKKEKIGVTNRKRLEKMNSTAQVIEPAARRRVGKVSSNHKVTSETKRNNVDSVLPLDRKPTTKRQQSQINVNHLLGFGGEKDNKGLMSSNKKDKKGPSSFKEDDQTEEKEKPTSKTVKKSKGAKITTVTQEDLIKMPSSEKEAQAAATAIAGDNSVVTKLKSWKEFFDLEEFQCGFVDMQKSTKKKEKEKEDVKSSDGSDSEPSVDCYELTELENQLGAALDHEDADDTNPFQQAQQETVEVASDDVASTDSLQVITSKASESLDTEQDIIAAVPPIEQKQMSDPAENSKSNEQQSSARQNLGSRYIRNPSGIRRHQMIPQNDLERSRIFGYPELENQIINQLIMENKTKMMQSSAAPPSGTGKQPLPQQNDMHQGHVLRGYSFNNPTRLMNNMQAPALVAQSDQSQNTTDTIYFTDQHRRMANRNASTQFTVQGQGVSSLNVGQVQANNNDSNSANNHSNKKAVRKQNSMFKGLNPLPTQQLQQMFEEKYIHDPKARIAKANEKKHKRQVGSGNPRNQTFTDSRHAQRVNKNQTQNMGISSMQSSQRHGVQMDSSRFDLAQGVNSQRQNQHNYHQGNNSLGSSQTKLKQNIRQSRDRVKQQDARGATYETATASQHQRNNESDRNESHYTQKALIQNMIAKNKIRKNGTESVPQSQLKREITPYSSAQGGMGSQKSMPFSQMHSAIEVSGQGVKDRFFDQGRYSNVRQTVDSQNLSESIAVIKQQMQAAGQESQLINPQMHSPLPEQQIKLHAQELIYMSAPPGGKQSSFSSPRSNRVIRKNQFQTPGDGPMIPHGNGSVVDSNINQPLRFDLTQENSQFGINLTQTGYSNSRKMMESSYSRAISYERKQSDISSSIHNTTMHGKNFRHNVMINQNGSEISQRLKKNSRLGKVSHENSTEQQSNLLHKNIVVDQLGNYSSDPMADQVSLGSATVGTSNASQRRAPAIGSHGLVKQVNIRKNSRNRVVPKQHEPAIPELFNRADSYINQQLNNTVQNTSPTKNALLNQVARDLPSTPNLHKKGKRIRNNALHTQQDQR